MSLKSRLVESQWVDGEEFRLHTSKRFALSKSGRVLGRTGRILKQKSQGKYQIVSYQSETNSIRHMYVHRMVAEVWVSNPDNLPEVNHDDGWKMNNSADNLVWSTPKQNIAHAMATGLFWNYPKKGQHGFQRSA